MRTFSLIAAALAVSFAAQAQNPVTALDVEASVIDKGYVAPYDIERRHGVWTAEATTLEGNRVRLLIDPAQNQIAQVGSHSLDTLTANEVIELLTAAGYRYIDDLDFDDGFWEAEATAANGKRVDLVIHPTTGVVLSETLDDDQPQTPAGYLSAAEIVSRLQAAGYTRIRDLDLDDGQWECDAVNPRGQRVELTIDARTGAILREERD